MIVLKYTLAWVGLLVVAILNAALRESGYGKFVGELAAHQISTFTGIIFFGLCIWGLSKLWPLESPGQAIVIGTIWLVLTVAFEFLFGHYFMGHPWSKLLRDYNLLEGRLWVLILLWIGIAPYLFYRLSS